MEPTSGERTQSQAFWESTKRAGKVVAARTKQGYESARSTVTQEEAFAEVCTYFAEVTQVLSAQHARIAALEERLATLEARVETDAG